jgi:DNA-binding MarR family transcriptional regulator
VNLKEHQRYLTLALVASHLDMGNSITDVQRKLGISYVTVKSAIDSLEAMKLVQTQESHDARGRTRLCIYMNPEFKDASRLLTILTQDFKQTFDDHSVPVRLFALTNLLQKTIEGVRSSLQRRSKHAGDFFDLWMNLSNRGGVEHEEARRALRENSQAMDLGELVTSKGDINVDWKGVEVKADVSIGPNPLRKPQKVADILRFD